MKNELRIEMYTRMQRIRRFEQEVVKLMTRGRLTGGIHVSLGQEASAVGACMAVNRDDYMTGNHRSHGHPIAKGADIKPLMAELFGKRAGVCKGKGGSMHLADFSIGSLGESGIVGGSIPVAVGAGLSAKLQKSGQVCLCFFGDGAANQGAFHEALNLASVWTVPVIFLCENNQYAVTTSSAISVGGGSISARAAGYGMPGETVDGQDPEGVYAAVSAAAQRARAGDGPSLIEADTYRYQDHAEYGGLVMPSYRTEEEIARWRERDPAPTYRARLIADGVLDESVADAIDSKIDQTVTEAVEFAKASPFPDAAEAFDDVYATPIGGN